MTWFNGLLSFVSVAATYYFFFEFKGVGRVCAECHSKFSPDLVNCPLCDAANPNVSEEW